MCDDIAESDTFWHVFQLTAGEQIQKSERRVRTNEVKLERRFKDLDERLPASGQLKQPKATTKNVAEVEEIQQSENHIDNDGWGGFRQEIKQMQQKMGETEDECHCHRVGHMVMQINELDMAMLQRKTELETFGDTVASMVGDLKGMRCARESNNKNADNDRSMGRLPET